MDCTGGANGQSAGCLSISPGGSDLGPSPPARWGGTMTYDASDGYVVMFGGSSENDTWTFEDGRWTELTPPVSPSVRVWSPMTYDAADGYVLLFGGQGSGAQHDLTDTWTFHAGTWTNLTASVGAHPTFSYGSSMAYDSEDGYVLLYGGNKADAFRNATWTYLDGRWTNITKTAGTPPACRFDASMADDPSAGYVVLFGGNGRPGENCYATGTLKQFNDTWEFLHGAWTELSPRASPPARWMANLAFSTAGDYLLLFDGVSALNFALADTWEYRVVGGVGDWNQVTVAEYPPARFSAMMAFDPTDGYFVLFGGLSETFVDAPLLEDVWTFNGTMWDNRTVAPTPVPRLSASLVYNPKGEFVLLFGGLGQAGALGDTWRYAGGSWLKLTPPTAPSDRYGASMAYDSGDGYVLLFGGRSSSGAYLNDTWAFKSGKTEWVELSPTTSPSARANASLVDDVSDGYMVLFGGVGSTGPVGTTWTFSDGNWTKVAESLAPSARSSAAATEDTSSGRVVLFGGLGASGSLGDTWEFSAGSWTEVSSGGSGSPSARSAASLVYDPTLSGDLLVGGNSSSGPLSDEWKFVGGTWSSLAFSSAPAARFGAAMTYDPLDGVLLLLSGATSISPGLLGDAFTFSGSAWAQADFPVLFSETGLPAGTSWAVSVRAGSLTSSGPSVMLLLPADPYVWTITPPDGWMVEDGPSTGHLVVTAGSETENTVEFSPGYEVSFKESGLPAHTAWQVEVNGDISSGTSNTIEATLTNGSATYVATVSGSGNASGDATVAGAPVTVAIQYRTTTFNETGLPAATAWSVTTNGATTSSSTALVKFYLVAGTYSYVVNSVPGYTVSYPGEFTIKNGSVTVHLTFQPVANRVEFRAAGLPKGTDRTVVLGRGTKQTAGGSILLNAGSLGHSFPASWSVCRATRASGAVTVAGLNVTQYTIFS
jgi:hypothetical protein